MMSGRPFSPSCEENAADIRDVLALFLENRNTVLEIGSGTGQHAVHFAQIFPQLIWQTSDLPEMHHGINAWIDDLGLENVLRPVALDVSRPHWPVERYDLLFTANTLHIMDQSQVEKMFAQVGEHMFDHSVWLIYGPFNRHGSYTSESNQRFDQWLKHQDPHSGLKDEDFIQDCAERNGLVRVNAFDMPSNNRILVYSLAELEDC